MKKMHTDDCYINVDTFILFPGGKIIERSDYLDRRPDAQVINFDRILSRKLRLDLANFSPCCRLKPVYCKTKVADTKNTSFIKRRVITWLT